MSQPKPFTNEYKDGDTAAYAVSYFASNMPGARVKRNGTKVTVVPKGAQEDSK